MTKCAGHFFYCYYLHYSTSTCRLYFSMHRKTGRIIPHKGTNNSRKVFFNIAFYRFLDINLPTQSSTSNFNVLYYSSSVAMNFSFSVPRLVVKVKVLSLIGKIIECLLMLDFEICTDTIVQRGRPQANSTNIKYSFTF